MPAKEEELMPNALGRLHVITDTRPGRDALGATAAALAAGAPVVQVRGKELTDRAMYELASQVAEMCRCHGAQCIVDDRLHVAVAVGDDVGAHVGELDLPVHAARQVLGPGRVLGATARDAAQARAHVAAGATYLGVGPCYATTTKAGLPAALGAAGLAAVAASVDVPVIAIAGVRADRVGELVAAGAHGVAVIDAVSGASDPHAATRDLLQALEAAR